MLLLRFICSLFFHRFGYKSEKCVRCGTDLMHADGCIISSEYDEAITVDNTKHESIIESMGNNKKNQNMFEPT